MHPAVQVNTPENLTIRREKLAQYLSEHNVPALLVTNLKNLRYLTGFTGSNGAVLVRADGTGKFVTDGRYITQAKQQVHGVDIEIISADTAQYLGKEAPHGYAVESDISYSSASKLGSPDILDGIVEKLRLVKDDTEIQALRAAGELADEVFAQFIEDGVIREGITELEAAGELEYRLRKAGADSLSFDTIFASGVNGSKPHAGVSRAPIVPGLITLDFGVYVDGYASDQTRALCLGPLQGVQKDIYEAVYAAFSAAADALKPGVRGVAIDKIARDIIDQAGFGEFFVHSTGHGVGLDVHEAPYASSKANPDILLEKNMTLTVEPGIYIPEQTGIRIENTYALTQDGAVALNPSSPEVYML